MERQKKENRFVRRNNSIVTQSISCWSLFTQWKKKMNLNRMHEIYCGWSAVGTLFMYFKSQFFIWTNYKFFIIFIKQFVRINSISIGWKIKVFCFCCFFCTSQCLRHFLKNLQLLWSFVIFLFCKSNWDLLRLMHFFFIINHNK